MRSQSLEEFAEDMRRKGDIRDADLADEILALLDIEAEVAEPYSDLLADLEIYAPEGLRDKPEKAMEWLGDRSNLLAEIEKELEEAKRPGDVDDAVKDLLKTMADAEAILEAAGWPGDGDFIEGIQALANRPEPMEYDL
jgi:hypothetical protein